MKKKTLALVAHDHCKKDLIEWVEFNKERLANHTLICTGTTGRMVEEAINKALSVSHPHIVINFLNRVPLAETSSWAHLLPTEKLICCSFSGTPCNNSLTT
jgi:hypothetical protein